MAAASQAQAPRVALTLVTGASARAREQAIAAHLQPRLASAAILEGLADPGDWLPASDSLVVFRIAPGCLCCTGNLVLRVTLNRVLRQPPRQLFIGLAQSEHLDQLRSWLQQAPYDQLLELTPVLHS
jgi:hypothetical protein